MKNNPYVYPFVIFGTAIISIINALDLTGLSIPWITSLCQKLPFYQMGFGWITIAVIMYFMSQLIYFINYKMKISFVSDE